MRSVVELVRHDLQLFGPWKALCDILVRTINRITFFKPLKVLGISSLDPKYLVLDSEFQARFLNEIEMTALLNEPDFAVSQTFLDGVFQKGDACFGIFCGANPISLGWYSTQPTAMLRDLVITVPPDQVYLYKAYTRSQYRGRRLLAISTSLALREYLAAGRSALVAYVESNNFSSLNAFRRLGAVELGQVWLVALRGPTHFFRSNRLRRSNITFVNRQDTVARNLHDSR